MDDQSPPSIKKINAMKARQTFGELMNEVFYKGDRFVIERDGKPMAALVPLSVFEEWHKHTSATKSGHDTLKESKRQSRKGKA
jgi:prevent-host-death family protein